MSEVIPMTLEQVYKECLTMTVGERRVFVLAYAPKRGDISNLALRIGIDRHDTYGFSLLRNDLTLEAHCYLAKGN